MKLGVSKAPMSAWRPCDEVVGGPAVEALLRVRREQEVGAARRRAGELRALGEDRVEQPAVVAGDVLDVAHVLVAALDLEAAARRRRPARAGCRSGCCPSSTAGACRSATTRPGLVLERVGQAAGLRAVAAVGAAPGVRVADVALAAEGDAQRAVDEELDDGVAGQRVARSRAICVQRRARARARAARSRRRRGSAPSRACGCRSACGRAARSAAGRAPAGPCPGRSARRRRRRSMLPGQPARGLQLVVVQDRVQGHEDPRVEAVGEGRRGRRSRPSGCRRRAGRRTPARRCRRHRRRAARPRARSPRSWPGRGARGARVVPSSVARRRDRQRRVAATRPPSRWRAAGVIVGVVRRSVMRRRPVPARRRAPRPRSPRRAGRGGRPRRRHRTGWARSRRGRRDRECTASRTPAGRTARPAH